MASSEREVKPIIVIDDDIPRFSGITDSNSPLEKEKPTKVKIEGRQRLCKVRDNDSDDKRVVLEEPNFIDIADFDSPLKVKIEGRRRLSNVSTQDNDSDDRRVLLDESNIVDIADFDLPSKVKIEGGRSLSTGSTQENNSDVIRVVLDKPNFVDIAEFDSPLKVKIEGRRSLSIVSTRDNDSDDRRMVLDESNIVDIADFDLPSKVKIEGGLSLSTGSTQENNSDVKRVVLDKPNFVDIAEFDSPLKVKIEGRRSLSIVSTRDNDSDDRRMVLDESNFVDIADFDLPLKVKTEGRWSLSIVSTRDNDSDDRRMVLDEPNFVDIAEFDSQLKVKTEGRQSLSIVSIRDNDSDDRRMVLDEPNFVDIAEFDLPLKVKTEGRQSLSIVSTRNNDSNDRRMVLDEPNFVDIAEFDLPLKVKTEGRQSLSIVSTRNNDSNDRRMVLDEPNFVDIAEFDLPLKVKTEGRQSLSIVSTQDNDSNDRIMVLDEPNFVDIAEFDSPLKVKIEGRRSLSIVSTRDNDSDDRRMVLDEPNFVDIAEFDSPLKVKIEGRQSLSIVSTRDDDSDDRRAVLDEPNFVDIAEFDSPLKVKIEGRRSLSIVSTRDDNSDDRRAVLDEPNFVDVAEFDSPLKVKIEGRRSLSIVSTRDNDSDDRRMVLDEPNFVDIADFDSPQPKHVVKGGRENGGGNENKDVLNDLLLLYWIVFLNVFVEKEMKVKIEGRQCLSKVSAQDNDSADNKLVLGEPNFVDIADFDLPPPKNVIEGGCENGVGNEIKDILIVLLLFYWSIFLNVFIEKEKPTKVKIEGRRRLCKVLTLDNDGDDKKVVLDEPDFVDVADLDFPPPKNVVESGGENEIKDILNDLSGTCDFLSIEKKRAPKRIGPSEDCVKLAKYRKMSEVEKADLPEYPSVGSLFLASDMLDSSLDVIKTLENVVEEQEEKSDLWNVSTGNGVHKVNNIDERLNRNEPKNLFSKGLPFMSEVKEEEVNYLHIDSEDDDYDENDCVALSGKRMIKEVERKGSKSKDEYDDSDGVNVLDDFVAENDNSITMNSLNSTYKFPYKIAKMLYPNQCDGLRLPEYVRAGSSFPPAFDTLESSFDLIKRAEGRVENVVKEQEKKSDLCNIFEGNKVHGVKNDSERLNRNEPKKEGENLIYKRLPFAFEVEKKDYTHFHIDSEDDEDEDEDDCFVLTGERMVKEVERQETKSKDECADSDGVDMLDDNFVAEIDGYITLNGPKSTYKLPGKIAKMQYHHQCDGLRMPEYVSAGSSFPPTSDVLDSSSDMIKNVGGRVRNVVEKQKGKSDLLDVSKGNRVYGVNSTSERLNTNEPKNLSKKLMSKGLPFVFEVTEEDVTHLHIDSGDYEDEDDCVVLSGKRMVKEIERQETKSKDECADSDGVDVLDDYTDGFVEENDGDITLNGPKSTYKLPGKIAKMQYPHQCDGLRMHEYVSAGSSFLPTSDMLDSSSNMIKKVGGRVRNVVEKQKGKSDLLNVFEVNRVLGVKNEGERLKINEPKKVDEKLMSKGQPFVSKVKEEEVNYLHIDSKGDKFVGRVHGTKKHGEEYKPQPERVDKKLVPIEQSLVSKVEERMDDDDEDACVILSGKRTVKDVKREGSKCKEEYDDLDGKLMSKGQPFVSKVKEEEVNYLHIDSKGDKFVGRVHGTKKHGEEYEAQPERVDKKLVPIEQSLVSKVEERMDDDDEDACVILSGKRTVKDVKREGSKCKEYDDLDGVDVLDDYTDDSVAENDCSITLDGPKSTYKLPGKIAKMLYPHQCDGLRWLWSLHCQGKGGILGDDMGLGKTMQICGFLAGLFHSRLINRVLVVAPKTLLPHWIKELSVVGLYDNIREYYGACPKARQYELQYILQDKGVLLTTYDIVRNNSKSLQGGYDFDDEGSEDSVTWDYMILDEGHFIKNPSTQRAKSLLEIPSAHRIIISGTPLQNNLKELWALVNFCCPDLLGDNKWFKEKFECAILRGNEKEASDTEKHIGSEVAKELREHIQPYFLRRLKNEVFDEEDSKTIAKLSKKNEVIVWLRLNSCQRQLYETFLKSEVVLSAFGGSPLAAITILKKICDDPLLLTKRAAADVLEGMESMLKPEDVHVAEKLAMHIADVADADDLEEKQHDIDIVSCKISFILSLLDNLIREGHCVLIFSQTRKMLNLIQNSIVSKAYEFLRIDGTTKASDRVKIVNDFQKGVGASIFLLTSRVGGLGLTLTRADRVIVVDPAWNPSTDNQSVDRAYRIGQTKDVIVYRLMTCGTVEEKIYRKQIFKGGLFKTATEHKEQIRYFSKQDLRDLFSLPEQGFDVSVTQKQLHKEHDCHHIMDDYLKAHIEFLQTQGIAGVSHHSLLFSKTEPVQVVKEEEEVTAPVQVVKEEEEEISKKGTMFVGCLPSSSSLECIVDGAAYDFKPKDVSMNKKRCSLDSGSNLTKFEIEEKINCLSQKLANKGMVSRLPDKGEKLQKQIAQPNFGLFKIRKTERTENTVIDLDD